MKENRLFRYFKRIGQNKGQLLFLISAFTFYLSIISIVFGVSSNIIDEYLRTDSQKKYDFRKIEDLFSFPVEQYDLLNKSTDKAKSLSLSRENYDTKEIRIIDLTVTEFDQSIHNRLQSILLNSKLEGKLGLNYAVQNILIEHSFLAAEVAIRQGYLELELKERLPDFELYYMLPICDERSNAVLVKSDTDQKLPEEELFTDLIRETQNVWVKNNSCHPKATESRFDLMLGKLLNRIKAQSDSSKILITILSDFDAEADSLGKDEFILSQFQDTIDSLKSLNADIKFNLIKTPSRQIRVENDLDRSKEVISVIESHFPKSTNILELKNDLRFVDLVKSSASCWDKESTITIDLLKGRLKKGLEPGYYAFRIGNNDSTRALYLSYQGEKYCITAKPEFIEVKEDNSTIELEYGGEDHSDFIGNLEVTSIRDLNTEKYSLWRKRVLNESTIGFIFVGLTSISAIGLIILFILLRELFYLRIFGVKVTSKTWLGKISESWYDPKVANGLANTLICFGFIFSFLTWIITSEEFISEFYSHIFDFDKHLKYWEPYIGLFGVLVVFTCIRLYERRLHYNRGMEYFFNNIKDNGYLYFPLAARGCVFPRVCHQAELSEIYYRASISNEIVDGLKLELFSSEENLAVEPQRHKEVKVKIRKRACEFDSNLDGSLKQGKSGKVRFENGVWIVVEKIKLVT